MNIRTRLTAYQELSKNGTSGTDWASTVANVVGGKAGGKGPTSQGIGTEVAKMDEAIEMAEKFITEKLEALKL